MTNEAPTVEDVNAATETALALERARGVEIPKETVFESTYKIGFSAGALWAIEYVRSLR